MTSILWIALAAASTEPVKLASPGLSALNLDEKAAGYYSDHFAQQLAVLGMRVIVPSEISAVIGVERQKALLGCAEESATCLAEISGALGADGVITGSVGKFGEAYQLNLKVLSSKDGRPLAVFSSRVKGEEDLLEEFALAARQMQPSILAGLDRTSSQRPVGALTASPSGFSRHAWIPAIAGGVLAAGGTVFALQAKAHLDALDRRGPLPKDPRAFGEDGARQQTLSIVMFSAAGAALAAAGAMYLLGPGPQPSVAIGPSGASFGVAVEFP